MDARDVKSVVDSEHYLRRQAQSSSFSARGLVGATAASTSLKLALTGRPRRHRRDEEDPWQPPKPQGTAAT